MYIYIIYIYIYTHVICSYNEQHLNSIICTGKPRTEVVCDLAFDSRFSDVPSKRPSAAMIITSCGVQLKLMLFTPSRAMNGGIIEFMRRRDYRLVELGHPVKSQLQPPQHRVKTAFLFEWTLDMVWFASSQKSGRNIVKKLISGW